LKTLILGPTFALRVAQPPEAVADRLGAWVADPACPFTGHCQGLHLQLSVLPGKRHRWSPWLTIEVREPLVEVPMPTLPATVVGEMPEAVVEGDEASSGGEAEVFGRFNPSPAIWTLYVLVSLTLITIGTGAAMWGVAACVLVLAAMWSVSAAGQRLAADEMRRMRLAIDRALGDPGPIA
jgi:hypothetical protein